MGAWSKWPLGLKCCTHHSDGIRTSVVAESLLDEAQQVVVGVDSFLAALQQEPVGRGDGQRSHLRKGVGPGLEDDHQDPDGDGLLDQIQGFRDLGVANHLADDVVAGLSDL